MYGNEGSSNDVSNDLAAGLELDDPVPRGPVELEDRSGVGVLVRDGLVPEGADAVSAGAREVQESLEEFEAWPDVMPLGAGWTPPRFPIWVLPSRMREMVQALAKAHAVPVDLPAMIALGTVAALSARGVSVQPKPDWIAPANLYVAVVAGVGEAKTPVFNALMGPLYTLESEYRERQAPAINLAKAQRTAADKAVLRAQEGLVKGTATLADLARAVQAADAVKVPNELRLVTNEPTPEALIQLCARTGGTVAVVSDEGGEIFQLMSRYVMSGKSNLGVSFVFALVEHRTFRKVELTETADGHVRLLTPLMHELAETMPQWAKTLGPIAEHVAHVFGNAMDGTYSAATPLTSRRLRAAQAVVKARKVEASRRATAGRVLQRPAAQPAALALWTCPDCGGAVTNPRHVRCEACIDADPASTPEIRNRRGAAIAARKRALTEWDRANPGTVYDPELFRREILPKLSTVRLSEIAEAAGCSKAYASDIRRGKRTPHVSTWAVLGALVGLDAAGTVRSMTERSPMAEYPRRGVVPTSPHQRLAEALAPAEKA